MKSHYSSSQQVEQGVGFEGDPHALSVPPTVCAPVASELQDCSSHAEAQSASDPVQVVSAAAIGAVQELDNSAKSQQRP